MRRSAPTSEPARYRVAGFWRRAVAAVVDGAVLLPLVLLFGGLTAAATGQKLPRLGELGPSYIVQLAVDGGSGGAIALATSGLVIVLYQLVFLATTGETPALRLLGMRVVDAYGDPPSPPRALLRVVGLFLSVAVFSLGILWIGFSREKRGFHDLLAGTWVVHRVPVSAPLAPAQASPS